MNGYVCSRAWYDFAFNNPKLIKPIHHAIIHWIFEKANESEWSDEFQLPTVEACTILGIIDRDSYQKALKELISFGAVRITQESQGRYVARWVSLEKCQIYLPVKRVGSKVSKQGGKQVSSEVSDKVGTTASSATGITPNIKPKETNETFKTLKTNNYADGADDIKFSSFEEIEKSSSPKVARKGSPEKFDPLLVDLPFSGTDFVQAWRMWAKYRKEIKKPLTESMVEQQLKKLSSFEEDLSTAFILQTIEKGWQGIFYELKSSYQGFKPEIKKGNIEKNFEAIQQAERNILEKRRAKAEESWEN